MQLLRHLRLKPGEAADLDVRMEQELAKPLR